MDIGTKLRTVFDVIHWHTEKDPYRPQNFMEYSSCQYRDTYTARSVMDYVTT